MSQVRVEAQLPKNVPGALASTHAAFLQTCNFTLSVVAPYYNQPARLLEVLNTRWAVYSAQAKDEVEFVVVDDGSPVEPISAHPELAARCTAIGVHCTFVTIEKDIGFNHPGALNTGSAVAGGRYVAFLDLDHWLLPFDMDALLDELEGHGHLPHPVAEYLPTRHTNLTNPSVQWHADKDEWYKAYLQGSVVLGLELVHSALGRL